MDTNQAAYQRLREDINSSYSPGPFVAIADGRIVADAPSFDQLDAHLRRAGHLLPEVLVVQAGVSYPQSVVIFLPDAVG